MEIYIYADILFITNLIMDWAVLELAARLLRKKVRRWRLAAGALFAALVYCAAFVLGAGNAWSAAAGAVGLIGGAAAGFAPMRVKELLMVAVCVVALSAAIGGGCLAVYFMFFAPGTPGAYLLRDVRAWALALGTAAAYAGVRAVLNRIKGNVVRRAEYKGVRVSFMGREASMAALVDTGHRLREPISRWPVVIAEFGAVKEILPDDVKLLFKEKGESDLTRAVRDFESGGMSARMRLIPFTSVGVSGGTLIGFRPDEAIVEGRDEPVRELIVAIYNGSLSGEGEYQALLSPELI